MKYTFYILIGGLLIWALFISEQKNTTNTNANNLVKIITKNESQISESSGFMQKNGDIITSYHGIFGAENITIANKNYIPTYNHPQQDIAILSEKNAKYYEITLAKATIGEPIFAFVFRNNTIQKIEGKITHINPEIIATQNNAITKIKPRIMTNLDVKPGDSGSPIWNQSGEMIDVIHILQ